MRSLFLSSVILVPLVASAATVRFSDVPDGAWFATYVYQASDLGVVSGYTDNQGNLTGAFGPGDDVTIAQALKMTVESSGMMADSMSTTSPFLGHWAQRYADAAVEAQFRIDLTLASLDRPATRAEMAEIVTDAYRRLTADVSRVSEYTDVSVSHPHAAAINAVTMADIMVGDGRSTHCDDLSACVRTTFRADARLNRAEAVKIVMASRAAWRNPGVVPPMSSSSSSRSSSKSSSSRSSIGANTVRYTSQGFVPSVITIKKGSTLTILNETNADLDVRSDDYPLMDALDVAPPNGYYRFTFNVEGEFDYRNRLKSSNEGTVIVK